LSSTTGRRPNHLSYLHKRKSGKDRRCNAVSRSYWQSLLSTRRPDGSSRFDSVTLVTAWVRQNSSLHELVIASDSRIGGGGAWDACPKIVPLPRPATVIAMSGYAVESYAFLLHAINTCHLLEGNRTGRTDLRYIAKKLRDTYADFPRHFHKLVPWEKKPEVPALKVALFGWSWRRLTFEGYSFTYDRSGTLIMDSIGTLATHRPYPHYFMGDAESDARIRLNAIAERRKLPIPLRGILMLQTPLRMPSMIGSRWRFFSI
jgi:hypothetical protein